ncbi:hypothetical protein D9M71_653240 [compost metagenome]
MVVQSHEVETECRQAFGLLLDCIVGRLEQRVGRDVGAPETRRGVVGEHQLLAGRFDETALARRFFVSIEKRQIDR